MTKAVVVGGGNCWEWLGTVSKNGYGGFWNGKKNVSAHRWIYEQLVGDIPKSLVIDHLCGVPSCVNPSHMETVSTRENILRGNGTAAQHFKKTHCSRGHPLFGDNLYVTATNARCCLICHKAFKRKRRKKEKLLREGIFVGEQTWNDLVLLANELNITFPI